jgi:hypothetical protein
MAHDTSTPRLSPRDLAYLEAVESLSTESGTGWCQCARGRRLDRSGLTWSQWRGAQTSCLTAKLVNRLPGASAKGEADPIRLTDAGREALDQHRQAQVQHRAPAQVSTPLGDEAKSSPETNHQDAEPTKALEHETPPAQVTGTAPTQVGAGVVVLELGPLTRAAFVAAFMGVPLCGCGLPMVERERGKDGAGFLACVKGKAGCGATASLGCRTPKRAGPATPERGGEPRTLGDLSTMTLDDLLKQRRKA